jgi:hypothetical protein
MRITKTHLLMATASMFLIGTLGCRTPKHSAAESQAVDHPAGEHPEHPASEHPDSEHPDSEHPDSEHPEHPQS